MPLRRPIRILGDSNITIFWLKVVKDGNVVKSLNCFWGWYMDKRFTSTCLKVDRVGAIQQYLVYLCRYLSSKNELIHHIMKRQAVSVSVCVLFDKKRAKAHDVNHRVCVFFSIVDGCSMPIVTNAHCDGKLPIAMLPIVMV
jgi:hypothetical protein